MEVLVTGLATVFSCAFEAPRGALRTKCIFREESFFTCLTLGTSCTRQTVLSTGQAGVYSIEVEGRFALVAEVGLLETHRTFIRAGWTFQRRIQESVLLAHAQNFPSVGSTFVHDVAALRSQGEWGGHTCIGLFIGGLVTHLNVKHDYLVLCS